MEIEKVRAQNLGTLVKKYGLKEFSLRTGKSYSMVSQWVHRTVNSRTQKPINISSASCRNIESILGLKSGWLDTIHEIKQSNTEHLPDTFVPLHEWPEWRDLNHLGSIEPINQIHCPAIEFGKNSYALVMRDDSMVDKSGKHSINKGDIIFIDPDEIPIEGDFVMATSSVYELASVKKYLVQEGRRVLHTSNPTWQKPYILIDDTVELHGVVIATVKLRDKI